MKIENIVILAGGESRRFWPLENKLFFPFLGKEYLFHQIEKFSPYAKNLWVVGREEVGEKLENLQNVNFVFQKKQEKGQAGALRSVISKLQGEALIVNGNDFFEEEDLKKFFLFLEQRPEGVLSYAEFKTYFPGGYLRFKGKRIIEVIEKPGEGNEPSRAVRAVLDYFSDSNDLKKALEEVKKFDFDEQYERAISLLLKEKFFRGFRLEKGFLSLKYPWDVLKLMQRFLEKIKIDRREESIEIGKNTILQGPVFIEEGVKIGNFCKLKGPLYIGRGTIIGDYTLVRDSHIGENCLIGAHSEIARSYLKDNVLIHRAYIGDSVVESSVMFGAGSITANFRFDGKIVKSVVKGKRIDSGLGKLGAILGKGVKVGSGSVLLPGVKIGRGSWIGPGEVVKKDVEEGKFVFSGKVVENKNL